MSGQKTVFIGLGVLVVLTIAALGWGQTRPGCDDTPRPRDCDARHYQPGSATRLLGRATEAFAPKVRTTPARMQFSAEGEQDFPVPAAAKPDADPRRLALQLQQGRVTLRYHDSGRQPGDLARQADPSDLPREVAADSGQDPGSQSFVVSAQGGRLHVRCVQAPCTLEAR